MSKRRYLRGKCRGNAVRTRQVYGIGDPATQFFLNGVVAASRDSSAVMTKRSADQWNATELVDTAIEYLHLSANASYLHVIEHNELILFSNEQPMAVTVNIDDLVSHAAEVQDYHLGKRIVVEPIPSKQYQVAEHGTWWGNWKQSTACQSCALDPSSSFGFAVNYSDTIGWSGDIGFSTIQGILSGTFGWSVSQSLWWEVEANRACDGSGPVCA